MSTINHYDSQGRLDSTDIYNDDKTRTFVDYDQANANPWSQVITTFDAQGRVDSVDIYNDDKTRTFVDYDQANANPWSQVITTFDAQGRVDSVDIYNDDKTRTFVDYDQANANPWSQVITTFDAQGRVDSVDIYNDDKTRTFVDYDQANANPWSQVITTFDAQGRVDSVDIYNDDKTRTFVDYDQANANPWSQVITTFDAQGRVDSVDIYNDDKTRTFVDYDQANANPWSQVITTFDAQGRVDSVDIYNDDKTRTFVDYDQANANPWSQVITTFDAQGRVDSVDIYNDDKTRTFVDYDQANANPWSQKITTFDAQGRVDSVDIYNDDKTRTFVDYDQANANPWSQKITTFDAQGRVDSVDIYNDDKTRTFVDYDQANANPWSQKITTFDAQGRVDSVDIYNDDKTRTFVDYDQANANPWSKIITGFDAQGRVDYVDVYKDDNTHTLVDYDQANANTWSQISYNYDAQGQLVLIDTLNDNNTHSIMDFSQAGANSNTNVKLPSMITSTGYVTGTMEIDGLLTKHATWNPAGTAQYATTLTYSFQNIGTNNMGWDVGSKREFNSTVADQQFNDVSKAFFRQKFSRISELTNLNFVENTSQSDINHGGADIRVFAASYDALGSNGIKLNPSVKGYADLPSRDGHREDYQGNVYIPDGGMESYNSTTIAGLTNFDTVAVIHELGHAMGLSHSFNDEAISTKGFPSPGGQPYDSTGWIGTNNFGQLTGGAQNSPNTDQPLESVMTYDLANSASHTTLTADFGLWDVAAMQHLYGANMSYHTGNDTYVYQGSTGTQTLWDAGGTNTIQSISNLNDVINLNQGAFSRVGDMALYTELLNTNQYKSGSATLLTQGAGQLVEENGKLYMNWNADFTGEATMKFSTADNRIWFLSPTFQAPNGTDRYNLAIDFGVNITNAIGGNGNDILIGNNLNNTLTGGAGNDTLTGGAGGDSFNFSGVFGNDTITDFTKGQDVIKLQSNFADKTTFSNGILFVNGYGSVTLSNVSSQLVAGADYMFVL